MELPKDSARKARDLTTAPHDVSAPRPVLKALASLLDTEAVVASLARRQEKDEATIWRAAWLSHDALAYVEASADGLMWEMESYWQPHKTMRAWLRRVADIREIRVDEVTDYRQEVDLSWQAVMSVVFADGTEITLPLFGAFTSAAADEGVEAFVKAVRTAWLAQTSASVSPR
jgi:hypothetical protein